MSSCICRHLDADCVLLGRVNLLWPSSDTSNHAPDSVLKLAVLGGVDERVDTAADVHQYNTDLVEPANNKKFEC